MEGERDEELERMGSRREKECKWDNKPLRGWFLKTILKRLSVRNDLLLSLFCLCLVLRQISLSLPVM